jgi:hypothetical protein
LTIVVPDWPGPMETVGRGGDPAQTGAPALEVVERTKAGLSAELRGNVAHRAGEARAWYSIDHHDVGGRNDPRVLDQPVNAADPPARGAERLRRRRPIEAVETVQPGGRLEGGDEAAPQACVASQSCCRGVAGTAVETNTPAKGSRSKPSSISLRIWRDVSPMVEAGERMIAPC